MCETGECEVRGWWSAKREAERDRVGAILAPDPVIGRDHFPTKPESWRVGRTTA